MGCRSVKWKKSLELELVASPHFDNAYRHIWDIEKIVKVSDTIYGKNNEIDKILILKDSNKINIEEKVRDKAYFGEDIIIEEYSNVENINKGWIYYSKADYLTYSWLIKNILTKILIFNMPKLRKWYLANKNRYKIITTNTDNLYHTSFRIIPINHIQIEYKEYIVNKNKLIEHLPIPIEKQHLSEYM